MTKYQIAFALKNKENTVVVLRQKSDDEAIDFLDLPGKWTFQQAINHNPVRSMWESRGLSIESATGTCYLTLI